LLIVRQYLPIYMIAYCRLVYVVL